MSTRIMNGYVITEPKGLIDPSLFPKYEGNEIDWLIDIFKDVVFRSGYLKIGKKTYSFAETLCKFYDGKNQIGYMLVKGERVIKHYIYKNALTIEWLNNFRILLMDYIIHHNLMNTHFHKDRTINNSTEEYKRKFNEHQQHVYDSIRRNVEIMIIKDKELIESKIINFIVKGYKLQVKYNVLGKIALNDISYKENALVIPLDQYFDVTDLLERLQATEFWKQIS